MSNVLLLDPLITPNIGLMFWTLLTFFTLLFVLRKFAWKPILTGLKEREESISNALNEAKKAREEMGNLKAENEKLLAEARIERDKILKEAKEIRDKMISDAKSIAQEESKKVMIQAHDNIEKDRQKAYSELKEQVVQLAIDAATRILKSELSDKSSQESLIGTYINEVNAN
jgi:F-type H+-transporting ATPase subunit b